MARKDLIEALQELEQQRRRQSTPPEAVVSKPSAAPGPAPSSTSGSGSATPPAEGPRSVGESAPGPKLERVEEPPARTPRPAHARAAATAERLGGLRVLGRPVVLGCLLLAFALGFLLGNTRPRAGGDVSAGAPIARGGATGAAGAPTDASIERALADPANLFTIQAISYDDTPRNVELAAETAALFRAAGLPAADPRRSGPFVVVVVGAAPTAEELTPLRDRVRAMSDGAGREGAFAGARINEIDRLFPN